MTTVIHASTSRHAEWDGPARYIRIVLHETVADLQRAASRYRRNDFSNAAGCFHPAPAREHYDGTTWVNTTPKHWAGVLRLARDHLFPEVVAHESTHAALAIYRVDVAAYVQLGNDCGRREETLAYIVGDVTANVTDALHQAGAWDTTRR